MHRLALTPAQRAELVDARDHAPEPYVRERAAALLKVADGMPAARVASAGLLRPRQPDTLYRWLERYRTEGVAGLRIRPGRGRKPAFSPPLPRRRARPGRPAARRPA
jgi:transposase